MKKIIYTMVCGLALGLSACQGTFLDLEPLDQSTDVVYFKTPTHFKEYSAGFYGQLIGWQSRYGNIYSHMDVSTDLSTWFDYSRDVARGEIKIGTTDERWDNCYSNIRTVNILLERAQSYPGNQDDIQQYLSEAYFFRAYSYFYLLKFFGGVPIVTSVLDTESSELRNPRNSRYEVVNLILSDLDKAIANLPMEQNIPDADKGRISRWAAKAFKARVLLYEATWRRYNGTSTDYEGSAGPSSDQINTFLDEAIALSDEVMTKGGYELWDKKSDTNIGTDSNHYLFRLGDPYTESLGYGKSTNKEFILYGVYDSSLRPGAIYLGQTLPKMKPSRKLMDMFLCTDGYPAHVSTNFQGYHKTGDEFKNRDYRMNAYLGTPGVTTSLSDGQAGYSGGRKFACNYEGKKESANYPIIRLAEVYLTYAEAWCERYGEIKDVQLNKSINKLRTRAGVASLTEALLAEANRRAAAQGGGESEGQAYSMLGEIRRERAIELYMEGHRFDDLKRWGIAETELNVARCGMVVGDASYPTSFKDATGTVTSLYSPNKYVYGEEAVSTAAGVLKCVVIDSKDNYHFAKTHYLWPLPQKQIDMNPNLKQNPGY